MLGYTSSEGSAACDLCGEHWYMAKDGTCNTCPIEAVCAEGTTLSTLAIKPEFFRFSPDTIVLYDCPMKGACRGTIRNSSETMNTIGEVTHGEGLCADGYMNALCASCADDNYHDTISNTCVKCKGGSMAFSLVTIVVLAVGVIALIAALIFYYRCRGNAYYGGIFGTVARQGTILFVTVQIITSLQEGREFQGGNGYPYPFSLVSRAMEVISLDLFNIFHLDCAANTDWSHKLIATTMIPIALVVLALLYQGTYALIVQEPFHLNGTALKYALEYLFYFLPAVSKTVCSGFACTKFDMGGGAVVEYMTANLSISCKSDQYTFISGYAGLMVAILPVGVPLTMYTILRSHRVAIESRATRKGTDEDLGLEHVTVWFSRNDPLFWWYSIFDMVRRLAFTSLIMMIEAPTVQMEVALVVAIAGVALSREVGAHWFASSDYLQYFCR